MENIMNGKLSKFGQICDAYDIKVMEAKDFYRQFAPLELALFQMGAIKTLSNIVNITDKIIGLSNNNTELEKWHELGHILHPTGHGDIYPLTEELSASYWAICNADDCDPNELKENLRLAFRSYLKGGTKDIPDTLDNRTMAKALYVEHWLEWR